VGGRWYVANSVVLPTVCHLCHVITVSDEDDVYVVSFLFQRAFVSDIKVLAKT